MKGFGKFLAGFALLVGLIAGGAIGAAGVGHKFKMIDYNFAMNTLVHYGYYAAIGAGAVAALSLLIALLRVYIWGMILALFALGVCGGVAYVPYSMQKAEAAAPNIFDVSSDTVTPPAFAEWQTNIRHVAGSEIEYKTDPEKQKSAYPDIVTLHSTESPQALYSKAFDAVKSLGWQTNANDPLSGVLGATSVSEWFGFTSDVVIRIQADGEGSKLDIRSASREHRNDAGDNAANIRALLAKVK